MFIQSREDFLKLKVLILLFFPLFFFYQTYNIYTLEVVELDHRLDLFEYFYQTFRIKR